MFGLFGKKEKPETSVTEPSVDWNPKSRVLTLVDRKGRKTVKKDPSSMGAALYDVVKMEIVRDQVQFTLHPKPQLNKDGRNKPRVVTFDLRGNLAGSRLL